MSSYNGGNNTALKSFLSRYLKFIIAAIVAAAAIIVVGIMNINDQDEVERMQATYTLTSFDYIVDAPSSSQVTELAADSAVEAIFPYYTLSTSADGGIKITASKTASIVMLLADSLNNYEIGFFCEDNCVDGGADDDGIMLDETAADKLGVEVGDSVSFTLGGKSVNVKVSGIYLACTYENYDKGIGMMVFTSELKSSYSDLDYTSAFIKAADSGACATLLNDYIPWANYYSQDEYITYYKSTHTQPPYLTADEWEADIIKQYDEYLDTYVYGGNHSSSVSDKSVQLSLISDKVESSQASINKLVNIVAISIAAALSVLMIIFIITNKGNDERLKGDGETFIKMFLGYVLISVISVAIAAGVSFLALWVVANQSFFASSCMAIVYKLCLPALVALPVAIIASLVYLKIVY